MPVLMTSRQFRTASLFCCFTAVALVLVGAFRDYTHRAWIEELNTPANIAQFGKREFQAPIATANAFYIAGLFLALSECLRLKSRDIAALESTEDRVEG